MILPTGVDSPRLLLERFDASCIGADYLGWLNDPVVTRFSNQRFREHTLESSRRYFDSFEGTPNGFYAVKLKADGRLIGTMTAYVATPHLTADMGIMIGDRRCWGGGFGLEAWSSLLTALLEGGCRKVTGGTLRANVGMCRIMERSGMSLEAVRARQEIVEQREEDVLYYARFRAG